MLRNGRSWYIRVGRGHRLADGRGYAPLHLVLAERVIGRRLVRSDRVWGFGSFADETAMIFAPKDGVTIKFRQTGEVASRLKHPPAPRSTVRRLATRPILRVKRHD